MRMIWGYETQFNRGLLIYPPFDLTHTGSMHIMRDLVEAHVSTSKPKELQRPSCLRLNGFKQTKTLYAGAVWFSVVTRRAPNPKEPKGVQRPSGLSLNGTQANQKCCMQVRGGAAW